MSKPSLALLLSSLVLLAGCGSGSSSSSSSTTATSAPASGSPAQTIAACANAKAAKLKYDKEVINLGLNVAADRPGERRTLAAIAAFQRSAQALATATTAAQRSQLEALVSALGQQGNVLKALGERNIPKAQKAAVGLNQAIQLTLSQLAAICPGK